MGGTGIGKSQVVRETALKLAKTRKLDYSESPDDINNEKKFCLIDVRISQLDPSDLRGLPTFDNANKTTKWFSPSWLPTKGQGIIFFDELNLAPPSIQAAAYQLVLDRRLGDYQLPEGYVIMSAGNRLEDRANIFELPAPLANRFIHCELNVPSVEAWSEWALEQEIDNRVIAFLNYRKKYLYSFNCKNEDKAFGTPRSWEVASDLIKSNKDKDEIEMLIGSAVGEATATEMMAFLRLQSKLDLKQFLENPDKCKMPEEIDMKYALILALSEHYVEHKKILPKILALTKRMEPEFGHLLLRSCKNTNKRFKEDLLKDDCLKTWREIAGQYGKFLEEDKNE